VIGQGPEMEIRSLAGSSSVLLSVGTVLLAVLLLNLLIAMFSGTFDIIIKNSTHEFLLQKAQLTFSWVHAPMLPPRVASPMAVKQWIINFLGRRFGDRCGTEVTTESAKQRLASSTCSCWKPLASVCCKSSLRLILNGAGTRVLFLCF
jgi:hypothetical protein